MIGLLGTLLATNQPQAVSNLVRQTTGVSVTVPDRNDPIEKEYRKLLEDDDAAQAEVDRWILDNQRFAEKGAASAIGNRATASLASRRSRHNDPSSPQHASSEPHFPVSESQPPAGIPSLSRGRATALAMQTGCRAPPTPQPVRGIPGARLANFILPS
jgi:hypothetical protein